MLNPKPARWMVWTAAAVALAATGLFSACSKPGGAAAVKRRPNVVVFMIDTLRRDRLGVYGYERPTSPVIDGLAAESVVFDQAYAAAPWTCPSIPSLFTSTWLFEHGIIHDGIKLAAEIETLAERFKRLGYHTTNIYVNNFAGPMNGMDRGFDICRKPMPAGKHWIDAAEIERWVASDRPADQPFFLYIHNIEPHNPHNAPDRLIPLMGDIHPQARMQIGRLLNLYRPLLRADWNDQTQSAPELGKTDNTADQDRVLAALHAMLPEHNVLYDAVVRHADERVGEVIATLRKHGLWEDTLFVLVSDHGEELAEHGAYLHSQSLYQELSAVPLMIRFPAGLYAGQRVAELARTVDVLPTIFDFCGEHGLNVGARGETLIPYIEGRRRAEPFVVVAARHNDKKYYKLWGTTRGNINVALVTSDGRYKGIWNKEMQTGPGQWDPSLESFELYDLAADPRETTPVCDQHPELVRAMVDYARSWHRQMSSSAPGATPVEITPDQLEGLKDLGYAGGGEELEQLDATLAEVSATGGLSEPGGIVTPCQIP